LSSSNGNYILTDNKGNTHQLTGETSKLSAHVGHEVQIKGTPTSAKQLTSLSDCFLISRPAISTGLSFCLF
jgi:hypothetical protein